MSLTLHADHQWISPYVFSVFVGLTEKGLSFETKVLVLAEMQTRAQPFRDRSITAKIPVLEHDGYWIGESLAIVEYLAETFPVPKHPTRLFPGDLKDRARARQLMLWMRTDLSTLREERSTHTMFYGGAKPLSEGGQAAAEALLRVASLVLPEDRPQLFADWCIADAELVFFLQRLGLSGFSFPDKLRRYVDAQWARPSVQAFVQRKRPSP